MQLAQLGREHSSIKCEDFKSKLEVPASEIGILHGVAPISAAAVRGSSLLDSPTRTLARVLHVLHITKVSRWIKL